MRGHAARLQPYRPIYLGDDLYSRHPFCQLVLDHGADFIFVCKPSSHKRLHEVGHEDNYRSTEWKLVRDERGRVEWHRFRWQPDLPVRDGDDAVHGTWIEYAIERRQDGKRERAYTNEFFTSLKVTADNVAEIANAGRARWKIENENFNTLANHGYRLKHNFGHGKQGLANLLAALNLLAFLLHSVMDCVSDHWCRGRVNSRTRREFFMELRFLTKWFHFPGWDALLHAVACLDFAPGTRLRRGASLSPEAASAPT